MAKLKREQVGSFCKSTKDGQPPYIKFRDGKVYRVESKKYQLESLEKAVSEGKVPEDTAEKIRERINKMPDWVLGEVVQLVEAK